MAIRDIKSFHDYESASQAWARIKPWRGESEHAERTLDPYRRSRNWTIRRLHDGTIACKLYQTDVVTYHPNGEVTIVPYGLQSTDQFMRQVGPAHLSGHFNANPSVFLVSVHDTHDWHKRLAYRATQATTFRPDLEHRWVPTTAVTPWVDCKLNRKRGNKVLKDTRYLEFEAWAKAARSMLSAEYRGHQRHPDRSELLSILAAGPTEWEQILWCSFESLREDLYQHLDCIDRTSRDWIPYGEVHNIYVRMSKWGAR